MSNTPELAYSYSARLHPYFDLLRAMGTPVDSRIQEAHLPPAILDRLDIRFSAPVAYKFFTRLEKQEGISDLAYLGSRHENFSNIEAPIQRRLSAVSTLYQCLNRYFELLKRYNNRDGAVLYAGQFARITCAANASLEDEDWLRFSDWSNINVLIGLIRFTLGPGWQPMEIALQSQWSVPTEAKQDFPNTSILTGQLYTSIVLPTKLLASSVPNQHLENCKGVDNSAPTNSDQNFPLLMKQLMKPYLGEGYLGLNFAAELAGMTARSFQRRLSVFHVSYSDLINQARFERATELMMSRNRKMIDIAYDLGYDDPSHFSRAFRRMSGLNPSSYQKHLLQNAQPTKGATSP